MSYPPDRYDGPSPWEVYPAMTAEERREMVVDIAGQLVGVRGESPECDEVFEDAAPCYADKSHSGKHWCGIFCLFCLRQAGLTEAHWRDRDGFIGPVLGWAALTNSPQPGDIGYADAPYQHHFLVERVADGVVYSIDGNSGIKPGIVARKARPLNKRGVVYYGIGKLVVRALMRSQADLAESDPRPPPKSTP